MTVCFKFAVFAYFSQYFRPFSFAIFYSRIYLVSNIWQPRPQNLMENSSNFTFKDKFNLYDQRQDLGTFFFVLFWRASFPRFSLKSMLFLTWICTYRVTIRKTFAQFFRNETQIFSFFEHQFCAKKQQFAQSFAKVISRKIALFRVLRNSSFAQFRN